jgi:chromosome segregation ATPase
MGTSTQFIILLDVEQINSARVQIVAEWRERREYGEEIMWEPVNIEAVNEALEKAEEMKEALMKDVKFWVRRANSRTSALQDITIALDELLENIAAYMACKGQCHTCTQNLRYSLEEADTVVKRVGKEVGLA